MNAMLVGALKPDAISCTLRPGSLVDGAAAARENPARDIDRTSAIHFMRIMTASQIRASRGGALRTGSVWITGIFLLQHR
jgi:hypothetical protein